ncbi:MAG TPA: hypothetical protein PJ993_00280 [Candidatus Saccharibacteria bacterium]|nr:hypothetical protein [Candidatus Saccharibacteria bacterium]HMT39362.1 hypothetical protein [Candidatus Saccharibacteria bacterium]
MRRRLRKLDDQVLEYMIRDRLKSNSPVEITSDPSFEGKSHVAMTSDIYKVSKSCERLFRLGFLHRKRHPNRIYSRYKINPDLFEDIVLRVQKPFPLEQ